MANHKKKRHPSARSHCSLCKPWKDGNISHESENFEKRSDHVRRMVIKEEWEGRVSER